MPNPLLQVMAAQRSWNVLAQFVRSLRLTHARDVVSLTLDREQGCSRDGGGIDLLPAVREAANGKRMFDEHFLDRLQIELGGEIHDGKILVIEFLLLAGLGDIAFYQMPVELPMCAHVALEVHGDEARQLHEAWIDEPPMARMHGRHFHDGVPPEPVDPALLRITVD